MLARIRRSISGVNRDNPLVSVGPGVIQLITRVDASWWANL